MRLRDRISLAWRVLRYEGSSQFESHARRELGVGAVPDDYQRNLLDIGHVFGLYGHSGFSAPIGIATMEALLKYKPLGPLTGENEEWMHVGDNMYQNRRCSNVFMEALPGLKARYYVSDHYVFEDPAGNRFIGFGSQKYISFPYSPEEPVVVKVDEKGEPTSIRYKNLRKPRKVGK